MGEQKNLVVETLREETDCYSGLKATVLNGVSPRMVITEADYSYFGGASVVVYPEDAPKLLKIIKKFIKDSKNAAKETNTAGAGTPTLPQDTNDNTPAISGPL